MPFHHNGNQQPQHYQAPYQSMQPQGMDFGPPVQGQYDGQGQQFQGGFDGHGQLVQVGFNGYWPQVQGGYGVHASQVPTGYDRHGQQSVRPGQNTIRAHAQQPVRAGVFNGNPNFVNHPRFAYAAAGMPPYGGEDEDEYEGEVERQIMTPESAEIYNPAKYGKRTKFGKPTYYHHCDPQMPAQPSTGKSIDLQQSKNKFYGSTAVYTILSCILPGGDAKRMSNGIYTLKHPQGGLRVAKCLKINTKADLNRMLAEKEILERLALLNSPHINYLYEAYMPNGDKNCTLILDHCDGGSVEDLINQKRREGVPLSEGLMWQCIYHICSALATAHNGVKDPLKKDMQMKSWDCIVHMDIKPANVFFKNKRGHGLEDDEFPTFVLGDWGCAARNTDMVQGKYSYFAMPFGTTGFMPPEASPTNGDRWGRPVDIWQLGALISCMCRLTNVPDAERFASLQPCGSGYGPELNRVVRMCLRAKAAERPTAVDVVEVMRDLGKLKVRGQIVEGKGKFA